LFFQRLEDTIASSLEGKEDSSIDPLLETSDIVSSTITLKNYPLILKLANFGDALLFYRP